MFIFFCTVPLQIQILLDQKSEYTTNEHKQRRSESVHGALRELQERVEREAESRTEGVQPPRLARAPRGLAPAGEAL